MKLQHLLVLPTSPTSGVRALGSDRQRNSAMKVWAPLLLLVAAIAHALAHPLTKRILLTVALINIPLQCGTHLGLRAGAAEFGAIEGYDFSLTTLALLALYAGWIIGSRAVNRPLRIVWSRPLLAYTAILLASLFVATDVELSLFQAWLMLEMLLFYIYVAGNVTSRGEIKYLLAVLLVGAFCEAVYMLIVAASGHQFLSIRSLGIKTVIYLPMQSGGFVRPGGTIGSPNYAAAYLALLITLALAVRSAMTSRLARALLIPMVVIAILALIVTFSRGGWLELTISIGVLVGVKWMRFGISRKILVASVLAGVFAVLLFFIIPNPVSKRLAEDDNGSAHSRVPLMHLALRVIAANPLLGVGANNFSSVMNRYAGAEFRTEWIYTVHNQFLLVCAETGVFGLVAYVSIYVDVLRRAWRLWKLRDGLLSPMGLGVMAGICGFLVHMCVDIFSDGGMIELIWLFAALMGICERLYRVERARSTPTQSREATA